MQVGASSQTTSYQQHEQGHVPTFGADDLERKRRYLSLLPPPQLIEICLIFDIYIPSSVKNTIWPTDFDEAIAILQKTSDENPASSSDPSLNASSLADNSRSLDPPKILNLAIEAPGSPGPSTIASTSSSYQAQRFAYTNQPAYPHTPYYPQTSWSSYSQPPFGTTQPYALPLPLINHQHHSQETQSSDEMPSYEDMIVEALNDVRDPEGLAPKDIYLWMVDHYRVQANFRPSASQALQKAYKRGRFEKSLSGKYRLNPLWKGGNTTRRTTRRPQSHSNSLPPPPAQTRHLSFTSPPLIHAGSMPTFSQPSYVFSHPPSSDTFQTHQSRISKDDPLGDLGDAFEAAQHILKALHFGGDLLKTSQEPTDVASTMPVSTSEAAATISLEHASNTGERSVDNVRAELQLQLVLLAEQLSEIAGISTETTDASSHSLTTTAAASEAAPSSEGGGNMSIDVSSQSLLAPESATVLVLDKDLDVKIQPEGTPPPIVHPETPRDIPSSASLEASSSDSSTQILPVLSPTLVAIIPLDAADDSDDDDMDEVVV
ncbi:hypothetical protein J3R30DRAFT_3790744 [Lentinula aciculospora]|uniref:Histone H1 n=1 Tax=Lentinula aciculospora TaxID=153920 RepID=A0A9W9AQF4_9AGAR|nr:hypothetical protein J3R30DRAFT_3790744 [Lentinula aciculospora]